MNLITSFKQFWQQYFVHIATNNVHLLIAVSGGIDSVVLLEILTTLGFDCSIAHCNFKLRGEESERDEHFVRNLATQYQIPFYTKSFDTASYALENKMAIQEAARNLRYKWFYNLLTTVKQQDANKHYYLLTAHHANDSIETVLFNFFRGTGIAGLHGILPKNGNIIRPLLFAKKNEIEAFAAQQQLTWVEDSSNATDSYSRNYIRHQLLPALKNIFPNVEDNILQNIERFKEVEQIYVTSVQQIIASLIEVNGAEVHIPILKLQKQQSIATIVFELVKCYQFSSAQVPDILQLLHSNNAKFVASPTHRIIKNRNWLIIAPLQNIHHNFVVIEKNNTTISFDQQTLQINNLNDVPLNFKTTLDEVFVDAATIAFPLLLRKLKVGDYFYPLGMHKKKKIARFLIDKKLSATEKEKIWVIESNGKIIWVVGNRLDDRFKITNKTKQVLHLKLSAS